MLDRYVLGIVLFINGACAWAQDSTFSTRFGMAILCLDDVEPGYFFNYLSKVKRPYRVEQGAYWFKTTEQLFGAPVTEIFVSDGSSRHSFVGIVSSLPPDQLAEAVSAAAPAGASFRKLNPADKYSSFISATGAEITYQGKYGKMYCRRDRSYLGIDGSNARQGLVQAPERLREGVVE